MSDKQGREAPEAPAAERRRPANTEEHREMVLEELRSHGAVVLPPATARLIEQARLADARRRDRSGRSS